MLSKLTIFNYALINSLEVNFHAGLNSVTGETGAGKSIILGALGLILGNRADLSVLKDQNEKCIVEGIFEIGSYDLQQFFTDNDLDYSDVTILRREITPGGKSRAFINDTPVNLKTLLELGMRLIDIHSQHQNLDLGSRRFQLDLVDTVAGAESILKDYREHYKHFTAAKKELDQLIEKNEQEKTDLDYWQFQFDQLNEAGLHETEQEELETELEQLTHAEEIKTTISEVQHLLDDEQFSVIQNLKDSWKKLESIASYITEMPSLAQRVNSSLLELKDILDELDRLGAFVEHDPERIELVNDRLNMIYGLQQKHRVSTVKELIELKQSFESRISQVTGYEEDINRMKADLKNQHVKLEKKAAELSETRRKSFGTIEKKVVTDLHLLGMSRSKLKVVHEALSGFTPVGKDAVSILFSANVDTPPAEISKIASGGEMSRLMLAIKNLLRISRKLPAIVFDEIDSGISGEIARKMGNILKAFSSSTQIINITHLPQIAAKGDAHFVVYKYEENGKTFTGIKQLRGKEREEELAKMVGGENLTETTLKAARELLLD